MVDMAKCEHRDEFIKLQDGLKEHIDRVEHTLEDKIQRESRRTDASFKKIDQINNDIDIQSKEHLETEIYVKQLYRRFDDLTQQMQIIVTKLDTYIATMSKVQYETNHNTEFSRKGKSLVYEILKWLIILALGYSLNK